jgi:hypothetical protein
MRVPTRPRLFAAVLPVLAGAAMLWSYPFSSAVAQAERHSGAPVALSPELQQARAGLQKYQDPVAAVHDGYLSTLACVEYSRGGEGSMHYAPGGMGVHFINLQLLGPTLDPAKPQVLIYEPVGQELRLAAAEWFMPMDMAAAGRPTILGQELQGPMEGHEPLQPKGLHHYDLHVWLWKNNPAGIFSATNPSVKCPKGSYSFSEHPPKVVSAVGR